MSVSVIYINYIWKWKYYISICLKCVGSVATVSLFFSPPFVRILRKYCVRRLNLSLVWCAKLHAVVLIVNRWLMINFPHIWTLLAGIWCSSVKYIYILTPLHSQLQGGLFSKFCGTAFQLLSTIEREAILGQVKY